MHEGLNIFAWILDGLQYSRSIIRMLSLVHNSQFAADSIGIRPSQIKFQSSHRILEVSLLL